MQVYIAGSGKLASELLQHLGALGDFSIAPWPPGPDVAERAVVVHAGSGREIGEISRFCTRTSSVLVELATGSLLESKQPYHPVVLCPNTNILMLKFMCMLERSGSLFSGAKISVLESHQATKSSVPGTAVSIANSLRVAASEIVSVRDVVEQELNLGILSDHLARHAFHRVVIQDASCSISMETRIFGKNPYVSGVKQIIDAISARDLEPRSYSINEFIENAWV